jgi:hypothetical protein
MKKFHIHVVVSIQNIIVNVSIDQTFANIHLNQRTKKNSGISKKSNSKLLSQIITGKIEMCDKNVGLGNQYLAIAVSQMLYFYLLLRATKNWYA